MNKQIPAANKIVEFHNFKRSMQLYQSKIRNAKPTLTTRIIHESKSNINLNKTAKQPFGNSFSRMIDIELQNKALLKKLTQKSNPKINLPINNNNPLQPWQQPSIVKLPPNNRKKYYQEHERRIQNEGLLKRIKQTKPMYQMRKFMSQRKVTQKYINTISKFMYKDYKPTKTIFKFDAQICKNDMTGQMSQSRRKRNWDGKIKSQDYDKENQTLRQDILVNQKLNDDSKKIEKPKTRGHTERNVKINKPLQKVKERSISPYERQQSPLTPMRSSHLSASNLSNLSQSFYHFIPQQEIKLNGKTFLLKGRQSMTKLKLELLEISNKKTIGNQFIHQVEIPAHVYAKKFQGRIDILVERLRYDNKAQGFYLL